MLENLKRWLSPRPQQPDSRHKPIIAWAQARNATFRAMPADEGFVVDGRTGATAWRLEWGPSQRAYVPGPELRMRAELGAGSEVQLLVVNRRLQATMEAAVFEQYVEGVQTRIDDQTPPEMRWLVMFPKVPGPDMGRLRETFVGVGSSKSWLVQWLDGPLAAALAAQALDADHPIVLMIGRGRLTLRTAQDDPAPARLDSWMKVFETAIREAQRVASQVSAAQMPSTPSSLWSPSAMPADIAETAETAKTAETAQRA